MKKWTKEEEIDLAFGYSLGLTLQEVADILGRTRSGVQKKAERLKIYFPRETKTDEDYSKELVKVNPTIISLGQYINSSTKIVHQCLLCAKEHLSTPNNKLLGYKCPYCTKNKGNLKAKGLGIPADKPGIVYLVFIHIYDLYKIGITSKTVKERFKDNKLSSDKYNIILERHFDTGIECEELEKEWLSNIQEYKINTRLLDTGNTETFRLENK